MVIFMVKFVYSKKLEFVFDVVLLLEKLIGDVFRIK